MRLKLKKTGGKSLKGKQLIPKIVTRTRTRMTKKMVYTDFKYYGDVLGLTSCCLYGGGGASISPQTVQLKRGVDIVVGAVGRVKDHIERGNLDFSSLKFRILDEADEMLRQGFVEDVEYILGKVNDATKVQTVLFSATLPAWVNHGVVFNLSRLSSLNRMKRSRDDAGLGSGFQLKPPIISEQAPRIFFAGGLIKNLESEVSRANKLKCSSCGKKGAGLTMCLVHTISWIADGIVMTFCCCVQNMYLSNFQESRSQRLGSKTLQKGETSHLGGGSNRKACKKQN